MAKKITFTNVFGWDFFPPKPAVKEIPEWYKNTPEYIGDAGKKITSTNNTPHTVKKCMPVLDAMTSGYILYTQVDVQVSEQDGLPYFNWSDQGVIAFHPVEQAPLHPNKNGAPYPKWVNPYAITTSPGYSLLLQGLIPAGTPMAQVIPIKRDSWKHEIGSDKERQEQNKITAQLKTLFFNSYKKQFWSRKEYR